VQFQILINRCNEVEKSEWEQFVQDIWNETRIDNVTFPFKHIGIFLCSINRFIEALLYLSIAHHQNSEDELVLTNLQYVGAKRNNVYVSQYCLDKLIELKAQTDIIYTARLIHSIIIGDYKKAGEYSYGLLKYPLDIIRTHLILDTAVKNRDPVLLTNLLSFDLGQRLYNALSDRMKSICKTVIMTHLVRTIDKIRIEHE
jgi:hypothetical protein